MAPEGSCALQLRYGTINPCLGNLSDSPLTWLKSLHRLATIPEPGQARLSAEVRTWRRTQSLPEHGNKGARRAIARFQSCLRYLCASS